MNIHNAVSAPTGLTICVQSAAGKSNSEGVLGERNDEEDRRQSSVLKSGTTNSSQ